MKIAVPVKQNNQIDEHFGHCDFYSVFTISENNEIADIHTITSEQGCGCKSNIANILSDNGVTIMLAGGIGNGAINVLNKTGIEVVRGCSGNAPELVKRFVEGTITDNGVSCQQHELHHGNDQQHKHECNHSN